MSALVLSLFPGIGLLDRGFEDEGFCVVRGPDLLWGGDVKKFHVPEGSFDGVIGGPPCQRFSTMANIVRARGFKLAENLIPEFERVVAEAQPGWFLMENVKGAPLPLVDGYQVDDRVFNNRWFGAVQNRVRRFCFGSRDGAKLLPRVVALDAMAWEPAVLANNARAIAVALGGNGKPKRTSQGKVIKSLIQRKARSFAEACRLQGIPEGFDLPGFRSRAKQAAVGNGVPYPMARAIAHAVAEAFPVDVVGGAVL